MDNDQAERNSVKTYQLYSSSSCWCGTRTLPRSIVDVEIDGVTIDRSDDTRVVTRLVPKALTDPFYKIVGRRDAHLERYTIAFRMDQVEDEEEIENGDAGKRRGSSLRSMRLMPRAVAKDVLQVLTTTRNDVLEFVTQLKTVWQESVIDYNRDRWLHRLGEDRYVAMIGSKIPAADDLSAYYRVRWGIFCLDVAKYGGQIEDREFRKHIQEAEAMSRAALDAAIENAMTEPKRKLIDALLSLQVQLTTGKRLQAASFTAVRDAVTLVRSFTVNQHDELLRKADEFVRNIDDAIEFAAQRPKGHSFLDAIAGLKDVLSEHIVDVADAAHKSLAAATIRRGRFVGGAA